MALSTCQYRTRFSRCKSPPIDTCQYCGNRFCADHTHLREGHEAVCARKHCVAKQRDLTIHTGYKARVAQRNLAGLCGVEDCGPHPPYECSLCRGRFCARHLSSKLYPFFEGRVRMERLVSVCDRCWGRRKIWAVR